MNIFFLDSDPTRCAQYHANRHVVKMILETAQLLSTAHRLVDGVEVIAPSPKSGRMLRRYKLHDSRESLLYKATHANHPCAQWARAASGNYAWLHSLLVALCVEYTHRYGRVHACQASGLVDALAALPNQIQTAAFSEPPRCVLGERALNAATTIKAYRTYYKTHKSNLFAWKLRMTPPWILIRDYDDDPEW